MQTPQNHDKHDRMVKRAVRIVPARQRPHYIKIWSAELARAGTTTERASVARAAIETARRLRLKDIAALLRGEHGLGQAILLWAVLAASVVVRALFLALIAVGVGALIYTGSSWRKSYWVMVASAVLFLAAAGFSVWSFTAADAGGDMSFLAPWTLAAFWVIAGSIVLFCHELPCVIKAPAVKRSGIGHVAPSATWLCATHTYRK